jgi:cell division protein ZapA (FtsZ GTPase activity inhibitor)
VSVSQVSELRYDLHPPLKIPLTFSGSFGELRKTHFHSGVDLKTNGKCGYRIYASEDGYVARIVVSPVGYGRAVYVKHPNGLMTVYAHLRNFAPFIEKYVRRQQYKNESWALDVGIGKEKLPVKKGMILGFSGNSGSSGGPHLHYEVRDDSTQEPINPFFYFKPKDNIKPKIQQLYVYSLDNGRDVFSCPVDKYRVDYINRGFVLHKIKEIKASGVLGFGIKVKDFINGSWNSCGVYSLKMFVNDELRYRYEADRFSFSNTSCVNVVKDYKLDIEKNIKIYKAWMPESCCFECVKHSKDNGFVRVEKDSTYNIRFEVSDIVGNKSVFAYKIKGIEGKKVELTSAKKKYVAGKSYKIEVGDLKVYMGKKALFGDVSFDSQVDTMKNEGFYKDLVYTLGGDYVPLRSKVRLAIAIEEEENIRKAANIINNKVLQYRNKFADKDTQDFLAMSALQFVIKLIESEKNKDIEPLIDEIKELNEELENILKSN